MRTGQLKLANYLEENLRDLLEYVFIQPIHHRQYKTQDQQLIGIKLV